MIEIHGNEILLDWGQSSTGYVPIMLAPWPEKPCQLPEQTPYRFAPHCCATLVFTHESFPPGFTWTERPSALKGCVGTLKDGYVRNVPLPRAPRIQYASSVPLMEYDNCYSAQVPRIPTWSDVTRSLADLGRRMLMPFSPSLV